MASIPRHVFRKDLPIEDLGSELLRHDPQLRIGPSMPIILQMCAPKHATFV